MKMFFIIIGINLFLFVFWKWVIGSIFLRKKRLLLINYLNFKFFISEIGVWLVFIKKLSYSVFI